MKSSVAQNKSLLQKMNFTHILNAAEGSGFGQVDTGHEYYSDMPDLKCDFKFEIIF